MERLIRLRQRLLPADETGNVFRGMATLALGSGIGRAIGVLAIPVLTRIYTPDDYGVLSVFTAFVFMLLPILTLRYVMAVPLPRHDGTAMNLVALSAVAMLGFTVFFTLLFMLFAEPVLALLSMEALAPWWWLVVLGLLGTACYEIMTVWAQRKRSYRVIARTQVFQNLVGALIKILLGLLALKPGGLLLGQVASQSGGVGSYLRAFYKDFRVNRRFVTRHRMWVLAGRYRGFPIFRLPSRFLLIYSTQAPLLYSAALYGAGTTGHLGLAFMAMALPVTLISQSLADAFFAELSNLDRNDIRTQWRIAIRVIKVVSVISVPIFLFLFFFAKPLSVLVFGQDWAATGAFITALSPYLVVQLISNPLTRILDVHEKHGLFLWINGQRALLISMVFLLAAWLDWQPILTIATFSAVLFGHYIFSVLITLRMLKARMA
ncbi:MAG: lipopolysaccharide biosynthesis protein [Marinobacter sp.]